MGGLSRLWIGWKALTQLGPARLAEYAVYRAGLKLDLYRIRLPSLDRKSLALNLEALPAVPPADSAARLPEVIAEAGEITAGKARLFGGDAVPLELVPPGPLMPWSDYERGSNAGSELDIKLVWEPARFGWAIPLARVYRMSRDDALVAFFWVCLEAFLAGNPPFLGPNWVSGQECALRILSWAFILRGVSASIHTSPERLGRLAQAISAAAARIPPTLIYARSQDNNHLLSESAGLYTAGCLLTEHPAAANWKRLGWKWFNRAIQRQLREDGAYIQQSLNYHRLMLQLACWMDALARRGGEKWPEASRARLAAAVRWLERRTDPSTGSAPNFGNNDGAYLFPFGSFDDQRPTLQAAGLAFLGRDLLGKGPWGEFAEWLGFMPGESPVAADAQSPKPGGIWRDLTGAGLRVGATWANLRVTHFQSRPAHADQLQVDLGFNGHRLVLDAGTYRYRAPDPWDNALGGAAAHNNVMVDGREPMTRAGRFLWLDWDQAEVVSCMLNRVVAQRNGYRTLGILHRRTLELLEGDVWQVSDELLPVKGRRAQSHEFKLHWLLPDGDWRLDGSELSLAFNGAVYSIQVECSSASRLQPELQLIRAGQLLAGQGAVDPILGWTSPTYNLKAPALSFLVRVQAVPPLKIKTQFHRRA